MDGCQAAKQGRQLKKQCDNLHVRLPSCCGVILQQQRFAHRRALAVSHAGGLTVCVTCNFTGTLTGSPTALHEAAQAA